MLLLRLKNSYDETRQWGYYFNVYLSEGLAAQHLVAPVWQLALALVALQLFFGIRRRSVFVFCFVGAGLLYFGPHSLSFIRFVASGRVAAVVKLRRRCDIVFTWCKRV